MSIKNNLKIILKDLPDNINLVAVSKTRSATEILEAYSIGQKIFGENKAIELVKKFEELPKDIEWHMIGHLQRNKVKYIAPFISLIHTVDSIRLLNEINKRAQQNNRIIDCLLQVHIATEDTKFGFKSHDVKQIIIDAKELYNIQIVGLMGMASFTENKNQINTEFNSLRRIFNDIQNSHIRILSIGMSGDYKIAINNGSNLIRLGSAIFGERNYK